MSLSDLGALLFPNWLRDWISYELLPKLGLTPYHIAFGILRGMADVVLMILMALGILRGGAVFMEQEYALPASVQATALKWAVVADHIGRNYDIPREVPLVLWFKENSMQAVNPELCTGIMGAYDLVRSGAHPCFEPGPISDLEVSRQLEIGAAEFKKRCPEITYLTYDPNLIKRCYFAYNAGVAAAGKLNADGSAYVMNNYDTSHTYMTYTDLELGTVRVEQLGAWPTHLAMQSLLAAQLDEEELNTSFALLDATLRIYDWLTYRLIVLDGASNVKMSFPGQRQHGNIPCLGKAQQDGLVTLRPSLNPVTESPLLTQDVHGCDYALPGIDISSQNRKAVLQAPMPGEVTTYTDQWHNTTIRIENEEWIVLMLHPRSYIVSEGSVRRGQPLGIMGAVGIATGPHVHYTIYDKINQTFVDPADFIPQNG